MLQSPYVSIRKRIHVFSNPQSCLCHSAFERIDYSQKQKSNKKHHSLNTYMITMNMELTSLYIYTMTKGKYDLNCWSIAGQTELEFECH